MLNSVIGPRDPPEAGPLRVRPAVGDQTGNALWDQLLPDRDAVHPVRHRGHLPVPDRGRATVVRNLRDVRDDRVHRPTDDRVPLRLATRGAVVEIERQPLSDLRVRQLQARDLLRGDLTDEEVERYV